MNTENFKFKELTSLHLYWFIMVCILVVFMAWDQSYWWNTREDYGFGYLVPLFALQVVYFRISNIKSFLANTENVQASKSLCKKYNLYDLSAIFIFSLGILFFALGAFLRIATMPQNPATFSITVGFIMLFLSSVFIFSKENIDGEENNTKDRFGFMLLFLFPALVWLVSAPLVGVIESKIKVFLLSQVTIIIFNVMEFLGFAIERQGNVLILPLGVVGVEEACSGIRSLTACIFIGSFLSAVLINDFWRKLILIFLAVLFAFITNIFRSSFLTLWAYFYGPQAIDEHWFLPLIGDIGSVHDVMGFAVLGLTFILLMISIPIVNFDINRFIKETEK